MSNWLVAQSTEETKENAKPTIDLNPEFSYKMLDPNQDLRKLNILMEERKNGALQNKSLTIGASLISIMDLQSSNTDSKFGYLMRHPTSNNQIGTVVSEAVIHSFQVSFTGTVNNWITAYAEMLYSPEQSFGAGTITTLTRNLFQLRKGYIALGDLNKSPIYGAIGKMDAPFGDMGTVSPFTNSTTWHAFAGLGYGARVGFKKWNVDASVMAVQGGAQFRALNTPVGDSTNVPSQVNNFVADLNYTIIPNEDIKIKIGASYVHGTAYCQDFPVTHFTSCGNNNPAYTVYGSVTINKLLKLRGGFSKTMKFWPGTQSPFPPLDVFEASKVSSLNIGAKYTLTPEAKTPLTLSAEFSNFVAGPEGAPWQHQDQIVLGGYCMINKSSKLFVELFNTKGYSPLNFISGSAPFAPFPPGETHSNNNANSVGIVIGGQLTL